MKPMYSEGWVLHLPGVNCDIHSPGAVPVSIQVQTFPQSRGPHQALPQLMVLAQDTDYCEQDSEPGGRGIMFLGGVDWMGFAGTKREEPGAGQVYPGRDVEGVEFVASTGEDTCTPDSVAYKEDTGR